MKIQLIEDLNKAQQLLQEQYAQKLVDAIYVQLEHFEDGEVLKFRSPIFAGEYTDYIGTIAKDGTAPVYNNEDLEGPHVHEDAKPTNQWNLDTLSEILYAVARHNEERPILMRQIIPAQQVDIIQRALSTLETALEKQDPENKNDEIGYTLFDIKCLRGMLKAGETSVVLMKQEIDSFVHKHGVDFPEYVGDKYKPTKA